MKEMRPGSRRTQPESQEELLPSKLRMRSQREAKERQRMSGFSPVSIQRNPVERAEVSIKVSEEYSGATNQAVGGKEKESSSHVTAVTTKVAVPRAPLPVHFSFESTPLAATARVSIHGTPSSSSLGSLSLYPDGCSPEYDCFKTLSLPCPKNF